MTDTSPAELPSQTTQAVVQSKVPEPGADREQVTKLIVAVHGVGDQYSYATLQSVVNQFCRFYQEPAGVPLGAFHTGDPPFSLSRKNTCLESLAFAEVYWAAIPRQVVEEKHTLEEAKKWASTIVERLRLRWYEAERPPECLETDFKQSTQILHEMIETIAVADRLCYLADKAGVFTFDLRRILDDYLGDVQIVTEFGDQRGKIIQAFLDTLELAAKKCPRAEIYIIAHSEGTVVSLLGLLNAFRSRPVPEWAHRVRGLMTLGSPIDKHLYFWPELFVGGAPTEVPESRIRWRNYYDYGDPIGFELEGAREWIAGTPTAGPTWQQVFEFDQAHDIGFTRYPFPGKAHVDYWADDDVFGHFIRTVVDDPPGQGPVQEEVPKKASAGAPRTKAASWITSWIAPYLGVFALLSVGAFVLFKAVITAMDPEGTAHTSGEIARGVAGLAILLFGITVGARVPRLTRSLLWRLVGFSVAVLCAVGYMLSWTDFKALIDPSLWVPGGSLNVVFGLLIVVAVGVIGTFRPNWGAKPMIALGGVAVGATLIQIFRDEETLHSSGPVWPVVLAAVAFLYLWWLAALLFDLVVVWHLYIRSSLVNQRLKAMTRRSPTKPRRASGPVRRRPQVVSNIS